MEQQCVFAWTQSGLRTPYPGFVNLSRSPMGGFDLIVRSPGSSSPQTLGIPDSQAETLVRDLARHLGLKIA